MIRDGVFLVLPLPYPSAQAGLVMRALVRRADDVLEQIFEGVRRCPLEDTIGNLSCNELAGLIIVVVVRRFHHNWFMKTISLK